MSPQAAEAEIDDIGDVDSWIGEPRDEVQDIDQILHAGWYLLELINEILDLAVIESGKLLLSLEPVSLADVMHECQAMVEHQGQKRGLSLAFPQFEIPCFVMADKIRLKQIVIFPTPSSTTNPGAGSSLIARPGLPSASASTSGTLARACPRNSCRSSSSPSTAWGRRAAPRRERASA